MSSRNTDPPGEAIPVPLRDFALPVPRTGSIEARTGYGRSAAEGQQIHQRVQRRRAKADPSYRAEVPVSGHFERQGFRFRVEGRMDGLFTGGTPRIEEIKSGANILELARRLADAPQEHPYGLQLLTYGYLYRQEHGSVPELCFHLVPTRGGGSRDIVVPLDLPRYEAWLDARLDELVEEALQARRRSARRCRIAASIAFPFAVPRPGQGALMEEIEQGLAEGRPLLLQAPTGLGKTAGVLYPMLRDALLRGQKTLYVTPKNSQHAVAEDAVARFREQGASIKSLVVTAKGKICPKEEPLCSPEYCEYARGHYTRVHAHGLPALLSRKRRMGHRQFRELAKKYTVCPFELQLEAAREADLVICDYNYVFAPRSALQRVSELPVGQTGKPNLVIDEFHNLPARAMDYYSPALCAAALEGLREGLTDLPDGFRQEAVELLDGSIVAVASCRQDGRGGPQRIAPPGDLFRGQDAKLRAFLNRYLDSGAEIGRRDPVLRLCFDWSAFTEALAYAEDGDRDEFFTTWHPNPAGGTVKITCCDASSMLQERYGDYAAVAGFSATLKPFDFYVRLSGLDPQRVRTAEFPTPFPAERRKLLIIPQVSTRYSRRERHYGRIAEAVTRMVALRPGNYLVFLPSFGFLERVFALFQAPEGFGVLRQERGMKNTDIGELVEVLRSKERPTIVFAVQGGSLAEGLDYAGETVIGAFVIGPPLPSYDLQREQMKAYYQQKYGTGFDYAYVIPAMARAVQAAGRVIRSGTDRGLIVLMDSRFVEPAYARAMPADWFEKEATELVSAGILDEIAAFWSEE